MKYTRLGISGPVVSRLAFGAMTMGTIRTPLAGFSGDKSSDLVSRALDLGINFFDTADVYHSGESELLLGQALKGRRHETIVATKAGMKVGDDANAQGLSARHIHRSIDGSLRRLNSDWVDVYFCHRPDLLTPLQETLFALDQIVRQGKVRYLGISNWPAWMAATALEMQRANGWAEFTCGQMYYSLVVRDLEHEYVPMARHHNLGTVVWSPLSGGLLSGKYTRGDPQGGGGRLSRLDAIPLDRELGYSLVEAMAPMAASRGTSIAAIAIAWLLDRPAVDTILLGFSNDQQFEANCDALNIELMHEEKAMLDSLSSPSAPYPQNWMRRFCADDYAALSQKGGMTPEANPRAAAMFNRRRPSRR